MSAKRDPNPIAQLKNTLRDLRGNHAARHRPSGFEFAFAERVDFLNAEAWDAVTRGSSLFLRRSVLRVVEEHGPENLEPRYALVFRGKEPVAAIAAQIVTVTGEQLRREDGVEAKGKRNLLKRVMRPAAKLATARLDERILVAGNLMSWGCHGIAFGHCVTANAATRRETDATSAVGEDRGEDCAALWPAVADALYRIRRAERLMGQTNFVLVKDITERESGLEALRRYSYRPLETEPNMVLSLDPAWTSYEDYLGALDAKYRRNAKDQVKKLAAANCRVETLTDVGAHARRLHELYLAVHSNASVRLVTLGEGYLPQLAGALGDDFRCTVVRRDDEILGFVTSLRDGDTAVGYYIGFDRAAASEGLPIYLRLLHATIGDAIGWGCRRLSLGRTALEPKAALGAKPESMSVWMRHRVPAMNWMLRGALGAIPHAEAPERSPFRAKAEG